MKKKKPKINPVAEAIKVLNAAASVASYWWTDAYSAKVVTESYETFVKTVGTIDFLKFSADKLEKLGFVKYTLPDKCIMLAPIYLYDLIPDGTILYSIMGEAYKKGTDYIDIDVRDGMVAFGINLSDLVPDK